MTLKKGYRFTHNLCTYVILLENCQNVNVFELLNTEINIQNL